MKYETVDGYIAAQVAEVRPVLELMRATILAAVPDGTEVISYNMPAVKATRVVVWYAAAKKHIGFYPRPAAIEAFAGKLSGYVTSKGAIQLPLDRPLPVALVTAMVKWVVKHGGGTR